MMRIWAALTAAVFLAGCGSADAPVPEDTASGAMPKKAVTASARSPFWDELESNSTPPEEIGELEFVDTAGERVKVSDYRGKKNVVLVFTRGFSGMLCPFCRTQSSRLVANYEEFVSRDAEILLIYPGGTEKLETFKQAAVAEHEDVDEVPFPILLDDGLDAVNFLNIGAALALPSTYILDKSGGVRFAYVGESPNDRPSVRAMLAELDQVNGAEPSPEAKPEASS
ncbi:MAG: redoxin domain-containing protein [Planctomycetota bacterium]